MDDSENENDSAIQDWEEIDAGVAESYNVVNDKCEMLQSMTWRRRITTSAVLSEHCYKITDKMYTTQRAVRRLRQAASHWNDLVQIKGSVEIIATNASIPPMVIAEDEDTQYIAFRGSRHINDWLSDVKVTNKQLKGAPQGCELHSGFYSRAQKYDTEFIASRVLTAARSSKKTVLCGHSLGGCIAFIKVIELLCNSSEIPQDYLHALSFGAPYFASQTLVKFCEEKGVSSCLHSFFHPSDRVPTLLKKIGFCAMGYFYYTACQVNRNWINNQFITLVNRGDSDYDDLSLSVVGAVYCVLILSHDVFCHPPFGAATFVSSNLMEFSKANYKPRTLSITSQNTSFGSQSAVGNSSIDKQLFRNSKGEKVPRDYLYPYFMCLKEASERQSMQKYHYDENLVYNMRTDGNAAMKKFRLGEATGVYQTASPCSEFYAGARRWEQLWGENSVEDDLLRRKATPVTFHEYFNNVLVTFQPLKNISGVCYLINNSNPRPPITRVDYERCFDTHVMKFPQLGPDKRVTLVLNDESTEILRKLAELFNQTGVNHNIPLFERKTLLSSWVSGAAKAIRTVAGVLTKASSTFDAVKEPHRVQLFVTTFLLTWGHDPLSVSSEIAIDSNLLTSVVVGIGSTNTYSSDEDQLTDVDAKDSLK